MHTSKVMLKGGSINYMSPEFKVSSLADYGTMLQGEKNDVFSLGITLLQSYLTLPSESIKGLNDIGGEQKIETLLSDVTD